MFTPNSVSSPVESHGANPPFPSSAPRSALTRYRAPGRSPKLVWAAVGVSVGVHALVLFAFNRPPAAAPAPRAEEQVIAVDFTVPALPPELEEQPVEELAEASEPAGAMPVPTLADLAPAKVAIDAFVQAADFRPQLDVKFDSAQLVNIPQQFGRGGAGGGTGLGNVFNLADLDRRPEAIVQAPPVYPYDQKRLGITGAEVVVTFIVEADGRVTNVGVDRSSHAEFEHAAITGVLKWKFRPGIKGGRKVATRMRVPLRFMLEEGDV